MPRTSWKRLETIELPIPPLNEQHRIAEILSSVDASIQATQTVIEQAERVKRGLMEELLTGGLGSEANERGEVPEGYEAKRLGDLLEGIDGGVSVNSQSEPASLEEKGILKTSCVSNSFFDASENKVVPDEKEIQRLREPVQAETIIFSRMNTPKLVGANAFVPVSHENLFLPDRLWALKPVSKVKSRWLGFYMSYLFSSGVFEALGTGTSGSMKNISKSKLKDVSIAVPSEVEQARVAEILSDVDDFIAKQKAIVEQHARTKRGLMDDLLTGKVRTV
jgi:type I restriction enzyme S subunit